MSNVVEEKWGKMGENGRISSYFASKWGSFECQGGEVEMGSQIETYDCLFRKGECSDALQAEWDV